MKRYTQQSAPAGEAGQVVLITLLVLSIATTVALSLIARTTTDQSISTQVEESARAFSAAEAGIEEALKNGTGTNGTQHLTADASTSYNVTVTSVSGAAGVYKFPRKTAVGATETLWLVDHAADGTIVEVPTYTNNTLDVCWTSDATAPALVVSVLYKSGGIYKVAKGAYDPDGTRAQTNNFSNPITALTDGCGDPTMYRQTLTFSAFGITTPPDAILALRIRPAYKDTQIAVDAPVSIPVQGKRIESVGSLQTGVTRKILVYQQYRSAASIFDASLFSQSSLAK